MPAGVSWSKYLKLFVASMLSMMAGAQTVHIYYRPLADVNVLVDEEVKKRKQAMN